MFPRSICFHCMDLFRNFARYRTQIHNVHLFMNALVELRNLNPAPIKDLFQTENDTIRTMLTALDICHKVDCKAEDLIDEFPLFQIAQLPVALEGRNLDEELEMIVKIEPVDILEPTEDDSFVGEELAEVTKESVPGDATFEDVAEGDIQPQCSDQDIKGEFLDVRDEEDKKPTKRKKYKTKKTKEPLQCPKCPYKTLRKTHYNSHQRTHLKRETRSYPCNELGCTEKYASKVALQKHMVKAKHTTCVCETCGHQCSSNGKLKEHVTRFHGNEQLKCEYCEKTFKVKLDLHNHVKTVHLLENVFKCETCGMEYRRKIALQQHQAIHSDVYNFPCQKCDKKFKLRTVLLKHVQTVHAEASLECEHCFKMFHARYKLLDHIENVHGV